MATLRFTIPNNLDARSVAHNALRATENYAMGAIVNTAKAKAYQFALPNYIPPLTRDEELRFHDGELPRNSIIFKFPFASTTNPDGVYEIILIGAEISAMRNNTIVSTPLVGRKGTVKEFIAAQDYKIEISGNLRRSEYYPQYTRDESYSRAYPIEMLREFVKLIEAQDLISVANVFLNSLGIKKLVLNQHSFQPSQKFQNLQPFRFSFISDEEIDLYNVSNA